MTSPKADLSLSETVKEIKLLPGKPYPQGATFDGKGVNFSIFSENATGVDLCLFDSPDSKKESHRIPLKERTNLNWHGYIEGLKPGQLYGYRVQGPYAPKEGHRFNPQKIVLDPYAKAIGRQITWHDSMFGYRIGAARKDMTPDRRNNAELAPLAAVTDARFDWEGDRQLEIPWHESVIYELHVKGMTKLHSGVPEHLRGTYAGLATDAVVTHLKDLGVTAVELMPVHHRVDDRHLVEKGQNNYWGYNTLSFFAPDIRYASTQDPQATIIEFKNMVKTFHRAGIEVILDVVYNHTGEGNEMGPTLSFRGVDNKSFYRLDKKNRRYYEDFSGCGNTLNLRHPRVLQLIMDSLRYWILEMHVDGFRFDLASALARELHAVDKLSGFFDAIQQDPVINQVKLIAEPWDVGEGGYQVGNFPPGWAEWNGKYRDTIRGYWKGDEGKASEFATRLCGSSDLYEDDGRHPHASINFITCHDGFPLQDLVTYNKKHNDANGEEGRDGENHNLSWNCGVEGPTFDKKIIALREQQKRNFMATLLLSQGVPMICAGDELSRSQAGNNNAYCQDNEVSWTHWDNMNENQWKFLNFCKKVVRLRREQPVLKRRKFFQGANFSGEGLKDIMWFEPSGAEMTSEDWAHYVRCLGTLMSGEDINDIDLNGDPVVGDTLLVLMNAYHELIPFVLPSTVENEGIWRLHFDTSNDCEGERYEFGKLYDLKGRSVAVFILSKS